MEPGIRRETFEVRGRGCAAHACPGARVLLVQPADEHDLSLLDSEAAALSERTETPFLLAAFRVADWNRDLSPWEAPPVFGSEGFSGGAGETRRWIEGELLPALLSRYALPPDAPVILGGYSLAGLFALWCGYESGRYAAVAAASPSVWFPGWIRYAEERACRAGFVSLSLGDREEKTRNPVMAAVGGCIRRQYDLLPEGRRFLEWNEGNHFREPDLRTAKAFARCVGAVELPGGREAPPVSPTG